MSAGEPPALDAAVMHFRMPNLLPQPCWHCLHFGEMLAGGAAARCDRRGAVHVQAAPAHGCVYWEREPGSDDEPGPPETRDGSKPPPPLRPLVASAAIRTPLPGGNRRGVRPEANTSPARRGLKLVERQVSGVAVEDPGQASAHLVGVRVDAGARHTRHGAPVAVPAC